MAVAGGGLLWRVPFVDTEGLAGKTVLVDDDILRAHILAGSALCGHAIELVQCRKRGKEGIDS